MKQRSFGLSNLIYTEWLRPIFHYYVAIKKNEAVFEIVLPGVIAITSSFLYSKAGKVEAALSAMSELMPTAISILIGFTVMLITLLLTSSGENIEKIKSIKTDKKLHNKEITLYQGLHIQFSHSLFSEILLLLLVFFYLFLKGLGWSAGVGPLFLAIETYLTLNILLSILRGVANLYFSFYNTQNR